MSGGDDLALLTTCVLPGTIKVTPSALDLAKRFQSAVPEGWIATFFWCDGRGVRANKNAPRIDLGPGLDLGAYRTNQIPEQAICKSGSFSYAVAIRKEIVEKHSQRTIDLDESGDLILR